MPELNLQQNVVTELVEPSATVTNSVLPDKATFNQWLGSSKEPFVIKATFNGPPSTGNGGYVCGRLANYFELEDAVEVTLRRPIPLEKVLRVERSEADKITLWEDSQQIAQAKSASLELDVPVPPTLEEALQAGQHSISLNQDYTFSNCFVCGSQRKAGEGLHIHPGKVANRTIVAGVWQPSAALIDSEGLIRAEFVWAALDCPGGIALITSRPRYLLLGQMSTRLYRLPRLGEQFIVMGWQIESSGRKHLAGTALFSAYGELYAKAKATWIELKG
jgi:hypothetical protein